VRRTLSRLSPAKIRHAKPGNYADGGNLYLQVSTGADGELRKSWVFRYELDGERHELGLGPLHTRGLAEAREKARELRQQLLDGIDPLAAKREAKKQRLATLAAEAKALTFRQAAEQCIASHEGGWKNAKHRTQWSSTLVAYAYPVLQNLAVDDITTAHVVKVLEPVWRTKPETASRVRGRIERVLAWATVRGYRGGDNPARWRGHLAELLPAKGKVRKVEHHPALPYSEMPAFMAELRGRDSTSARALEFTILTAARTGEVIGAKRSEIDETKKTWTVPPGRMKAGKAHVVPLSDRALAILKALTHHRSEYIFAGLNGEPLSNMAMLELLRGMRPGHTVHGFRSTFRDWAAERTNYPNHVVEMALAHTVADKVEAAYRRGELLEKRRRLMAAWTDYCMRPVTAPAGNVVELREGARA
jgi:integrase